MPHHVPDRVQQVRLAETRTPEDEQRVVNVSGILGDGGAGSVGEAVAAADDERVEREPRIELPLHGGGRSRGRDLRRRQCGGSRPIPGGPRRRQRLARREPHVGILPEHLRQALAQHCEVMLVDPVHEKRVGNFQVDGLGADLHRCDRLEPGVEGLRTAQPIADQRENLLPEESRLLRLHGLDGHFNGPC